MNADSLLKDATSKCYKFIVNKKVDHIDNVVLVYFVLLVRSVSIVRQGL